MEAKAVKRYIRSSPRKMRLVIDLIRGKNAAEALAILKFTPKSAARDAEQVLLSAIANLGNQEQTGVVRPDALVVKEVYVNQGATAKRISPAPMGRAYRIRKRSHHLTITVSTQ